MDQRFHSDSKVHREALVPSFGDSLGTCIWGAIRASFHGIVAPSALEGPSVSIGMEFPS
jgi:hypothetical protein